MGLEPNLATKLQQSLSDTARRQESLGQTAVLLVSGALRSTMARFARFSVPGLKVLSFQEVPDNKQIKIVERLGRKE